MQINHGEKSRWSDDLELVFNDGNITCIDNNFILGLETDDFRGDCGDGVYPILNLVNNALK